MKIKLLALSLLFGCGDKEEKSIDAVESKEVEVVNTQNTQEVSLTTETKQEETVVPTNETTTNESKTEETIIEGESTND